MAIGPAGGLEGPQGVEDREPGGSVIDQDEIQSDTTAEGQGQGNSNNTDGVEGGGGIKGEGGGEGKGQEQSSPAQERKWDERFRAFVESFPDRSAGTPIGNKVKDKPDLNVYMRDCGPLGDRDVFEAAEVLMTTGLTDEGKDRHIKTKLYRGQVPWNNVEDLLRDVDRLPHGPSWNIIDIEVYVEGENIPRVAHLCARDIIEVIAELIGNPRFAKFMKYAPERHWTAENDGVRIYNELWTGDWWWSVQQLLNEAHGSSTVAALILSSDKTQLSLLPGGQQAYPVYLTLGNISKSIRRQANERATVLLGYLPVEDFGDIANDDERQRLKGQLVHDAMRELMRPLEEASRNGIEMWCADGQLRRVFPIVATYVADWPEQCLMACTMLSRCPICEVEHDGRGDYEQAPRRKPADTLKALEDYFDNRDLKHLNQGFGLKPWWPWWANIPYCNIHASITPDLLHQLWLGMFKTHILAWMQWAIGKGKLDELYMAMPEASGLRHFSNGLSGIGQWTGRETREMAKQLVCAIAGIADTEQVELTRSGIEFMCYAESPALNESDIAEMERLLSRFHDLKWVMVDEKDGYYKKESSFDGIPKLHMATHYGASIRLYGTPDGYNSEVPENLHIHYAKKPWRASNKVRPESQMMRYLQRQEAIHIHRSYMNTYHGIEVEGEHVIGGGVDEGGPTGMEATGQTLDSSSDNLNVSALEPSKQVVYPDPKWSIAQNPTHSKVPCRVIERDYGAKDFIKLLTKLLADQFETPPYASLLSPNHEYAVWHRLYLQHLPFPSTARRSHIDTIRANPPPRNHAGTNIGLGIHDTVLMLDKPGAGGIYRYRAARVRVIFKLPVHLRYTCDEPLAYVELFNPFSSTPLFPPYLYSTSRSLHSDGRRRDAIVPVSDLKLACHLAPQFSRLRDWTPGPNRDIMSIAQHFHLNPHYNHYMFALLENWRRSGIRFKRVVRFVD